MQFIFKYDHSIPVYTAKWSSHILALAFCMTSMEIAKFKSQCNSMMQATLVFNNIRKMPAYMLTDLSIGKVKIVNWNLFPSLCITKMRTYYKHICIIFISYNASIASKSTMNVKHKCLGSRSAMNVLYFNYCVLNQSIS